jgi:hypothetical protein
VGSCRRCRNRCEERKGADQDFPSLEKSREGRFL